MANNTLYVVTCISNPVRYKTRYDLYRKFAKHMADSPNVELYTTEMAFGNRAFEITERDNPRHIQVRSFYELWHKENMLNLAIQRLPEDWEYVAWIDADILFNRPDWAQETVEQVPAPAEVLARLRDFAQAHYTPETPRRKRPDSFRSLQDRFGNPASVSTEKLRGGGPHG